MVDDHEIIVRTVGRLFRVLGHEAIVVLTSAEGRDAVERLRPDVVIVDLRLQNGESGIDFLTWLAAHHPQIRRVLTSGASMPEGFVIEPGRQTFLPKPFGAAEVQRAITPGG